MKKLIAQVDFTSNGRNFVKDDEIVTDNYEAIVKLNEKGFIQPLTYKDLVLIKRELDSRKKTKKEEEK